MQALSKAGSRPESTPGSPPNVLHRKANGQIRIIDRFEYRVGTQTGTGRGESTVNQISCVWGLG